MLPSGVILAEAGAHTNESRAKRARKLGSEHQHQHQHQRRETGSSSLTSSLAQATLEIISSTSHYNPLLLTWFETPNTKRTTLQRILKSIRNCDVTKVKNIYSQGQGRISRIKWKSNTSPNPEGCLTNLSRDFPATLKM